MGGYTFAQWLELWPASLLAGLTSPFTWAGTALAVLLPITHERLVEGRPARRRKDPTR